MRWSRRRGSQIDGASPGRAADVICARSLPRSRRRKQIFPANSVARYSSCAHPRAFDKTRRYPGRLSRIRLDLKDHQQHHVNTRAPERSDNLGAVPRPAGSRHHSHLGSRGRDAVIDRRAGRAQHVKQRRFGDVLARTTGSQPVPGGDDRLRQIGPASHGCSASRRDSECQLCGLTDPRMGPAQGWCPHGAGRWRAALPAPRSAPPGASHI